MKILSIIAVIAAIALAVIGGLIVVKSGGVQFVTPNALLRLADTSLLLAIAVSLLTLVLKKD